MTLTSLSSGVVAPPTECIERDAWHLHGPAYEFTILAPDEDSAELARARLDAGTFGMGLCVVDASGTMVPLDPRTVRIEVAR